MSGAHKIQVPENYCPPGVNNEVRFYFDRESVDFEKNFGENYGGGRPPPFGTPSVVAQKNRFDFLRKPSLCVKNKITSRRQRRLPC